MKAPKTVDQMVADIKEGSEPTLTIARCWLADMITAGHPKIIIMLLQGLEREMEEEFRKWQVGSNGNGRLR